MTNVAAGPLLRNIAAIALFALVLVPVRAHAGIDDAGTAVAGFLSLGTGPDALAMGGAAIGRSGTLDLATWNPGSLGFLRETSVELSHANLDDQAAQEWASLGGRFGASHTAWGLSALYESEGTFEGRDASNMPTQDFPVASAAAIVQLAQGVGPHVSFGVAGKYVVDSQGPAQKATGMTMDAGLSLRLGIIGLGFAAQNAVGQMTYGDTKYPFPSNYGVGLSVTHPNGVTAAIDLNAPSTSYTNVRGGLEYRYKQVAVLRAGYRFELGGLDNDALAGPSFGTGFGTHAAWLDYGFMLNGNQGGQHRLAVTFRLPGGSSTGLQTDPFGQSSMPRDFDDPRQVGPPAPRSTKPAKQSKS